MTDDELAAVAAALLHRSAETATPDEGVSPWLLAARREAVGIE